MKDGIHAVMGGWELDPTIILHDGSACWCDPQMFDYTSHTTYCRRRRSCKRHPLVRWLPNGNEWECQKCGRREKV